MENKFAFDLRQWQKRAYQVFLAGKENCLICATPGSGKTIFALKCIHGALIDGDAIFVVIVVPSDSLRDQWVKEASKVGIDLSSDTTIQLGADYAGVVTTYAALGHGSGGSLADIGFHTRRRKTIAILDEPHHLGTGLNWSNGTTEALSRCVRRLLVTGTPFRSDTNLIPYVHYKPVGDQLESVCDFVYGYGDALRDGVVRPVYFETFDGEITWFKDEREYSESVSSDVPKYIESDLRRHTLDARGNWMAEVLKSANNKLTEIRSDQDERAGGIVLTYDKRHAYMVAAVMERFLGFSPVVIVSDDDKTDDGISKIDAFRESDEPWLVAVKKVCEGVDIKRLRVEVYATITKTELFFRQAIGRVLRIDPLAQDPPEEQAAYVFIPKFKDVQEFAEQIKQERVHAIDDMEAWLEEIDEEPQTTRSDSFVGSVFVSSESEYGGIVHDGENFSPIQIEAKRKELKAMGLPVSEEVVLSILRYDKLVGINQNGAAHDGGDKKAIPLEMKIHKYTRRGGPISRRVAQLIEMSSGRLDYKHVYASLNKRQRIDRFNAATVTLQQCQERVALLDEWIRKGWLYYA